MAGVTVFNVPFSIASVKYDGDVVVSPGGSLVEAIIYSTSASEAIVYDLAVLKIRRVSYGGCGGSKIEGRGLVGDYAVVWGRGFYGIFSARICGDPVYELRNVAIAGWGVDSLGLYHLIRGKKTGELLVVVTSTGYSVYRLGHKRRRRISYSNGVAVIEYDGYSVIAYGDEYVEVPMNGLTPLGIVSGTAALFGSDGWIYIVDGYNIERIARCSVGLLVVPMVQGGVALVCRERGLLSIGGVVDKGFLDAIALVDGQGICIPGSGECILRLRLSPIVDRGVKPRILYPLIVLPLGKRILVVNTTSTSAIVLPSPESSTPPCIIGVNGSCRSLEGVIVDVDKDRLRGLAGPSIVSRKIVVAEGTIELEAKVIADNAKVKASSALIGGNAWSRILREKLSISLAPGDRPRVKRELVGVESVSSGRADLRIAVRLMFEDVILGRDRVSIRASVESNLDITGVVALEECYLRDVVWMNEHNVLLLLRVKSPYRCLLQLGLDDYWAVVDLSEGIKNVVERRLGEVGEIAVKPSLLCVTPRGGSIIVSASGEELVASETTCIKLSGGANRVSILARSGMKEFIVYGAPEVVPRMRIEGNRLCIDAGRGSVVNIACGDQLVAEPKTACIEVTRLLGVGGRCSSVALWLGGKASIDVGIGALVGLAARSALFLRGELSKLVEDKLSDLF